MNSVNHFLASVSLLLIFFGDKVNLGEIILFSIVFGVLVDLDLITGILLQKPPKHHRTWLHEPFGVLIMGIPAGLLLSKFNPYYLPLTVIPYASHIILDYLTIHEVSPLAPFLKTPVRLGFIKPFPHPKWLDTDKGISENYFMIPNAAMFALLVL